MEHNSLNQNNGTGFNPPFIGNGMHPLSQSQQFIPPNPQWNRDANHQQKPSMISTKSNPLPMYNTNARTYSFNSQNTDSSHHPNIHPLNRTNTTSPIQNQHPSLHRFRSAPSNINAGVNVHYMPQNNIVINNNIGYIPPPQNQNVFNVNLA
eukprot:393913_1